MTLGRHLKYVREQSKQSLAEVSGAVEIGADMLERIEAGSERPHEDILLLLISYFNIQDQEAVQLWELAGYEGDVPDTIRPADIAELPIGGKGMVMLLALDMRTMYSDGLEIENTDAGLTLSFTQTTQKQATPVARLGMSYDQAQSVINTLQQALLQRKYNHGPKRLPPHIGSEEQTD